MATTKQAQVKTAPKKKAPAEEYFYAVGRRKTATAQVRLFVDEKAAEPGVVVNERAGSEYFPTTQLQNIFMAPFRVLGAMGYRVTLLVRGGGVHGQADAARLAIARAFVKLDAANRALLKANGLLVRDSREVERKKPGLKKARRSPQWSKR
ncbi:MAG: 30S ribosomal protein S9 [Candidatus Moranbacteria bacterium]|nr:30S ribosomal protein S9 [Candidatus Moranbacteria bacterium]